MCAIAVFQFRSVLRKDPWRRGRYDIFVSTGRLLVVSAFLPRSAVRVCLAIHCDATIAAALSHSPLGCVPLHPVEHAQLCVGGWRCVYNFLQVSVAMDVAILWMLLPC